MKFVARDRFNDRAVMIVAAFILYTLFYFGQTALPGNPTAPLGWWGWFDQGQYIGSARSFADGSWRSYDHFYPPVYPWLGSLFIRIWPAHPFFLIDFVGLALTLLAMSMIARQVLTASWLLLAVVGTFVLFPLLTVTQWEIPWTTSLSSGIGAALLLCFLSLSSKGWRISDMGSWVALAIFSFLYGAIGAVRPLDVVVWSPAALVFYANALGRNLKLQRSDLNWKKTASLGIVVCAFGLITPALYIYFNEMTAGNIFGGYVSKIGTHSYQIHSLVRKTISIMFDSSAVYYEKGQALSDGFPLLYLAVPATIYAFFRSSVIIKVISSIISLQFLTYIPYTDLLPNGVYRYYNVHYFKWTFPWLSIFTLSFLLDILKSSLWNRKKAFGFSFVISGCLLLATVHLQDVVVGQARATPVGDHGVEVTLNSPQRLDFVDISGVQGSWPAIYLGNQGLDVDGVPFTNIGMFRILPTAHGIRVVLARSTVAQVLKVRLDDAVSVEPDMLAARAVGVRVSFGCWAVSSCDLPAAVPLVSEKVTLSLGDAMADRFLRSAWQDRESWGRWTSAADAVLGFRVPEPRDLTISAEVRPLISASHPRASIVLSANNCQVGTVEFSYPDDTRPKTITGAVSKSCIPSSGIVSLHLSSSGVVTPRDIGVSDDNRAIGAGLDLVEIR